MRTAIILLFLCLSSMAESCKVLKNLTTPGDTSAVITTGGYTLACITPDQLRSLMVADSAFSVCTQRVDELWDLVDTQEKRAKVSEQAFAVAVSSAKQMQSANDTLKAVSAKADTIIEYDKAIRKLTEEKLERCEKNTPTFWERTSQVAGALLLGVLLGSFL